LFAFTVVITTYKGTVVAEQIGVQPLVVVLGKVASAAIATDDSPWKHRFVDGHECARVPVDAAIVTDVCVNPEFAGLRTV
jgi:hypothetical protein